MIHSGESGAAANSGTRVQYAAQHMHAQVYRETKTHKY